MLADSLGDGFVDVRPYPGADGASEDPGIIPGLSMNGWAPVHRAFFDHDEHNVVHAISAWTRVVGLDGRVVCAETQIPARDQLMIFDDVTTAGFERQEYLVHEFGHVFGMDHYSAGHPDHRNYRAAPGDDGCVMVYDDGQRQPPPVNVNDSLNGQALFGGKASDGAGQPQDLRVDIAGHPEPVVN